MNDPTQIDHLTKKYLSKSITDQEYAEYCMYSLVKYYIRDVFKPGTNVQLSMFLQETIKDQMETFNDSV
jgi:hypothetical protein